jgi:thiol peroxidase
MTTERPNAITWKGKSYTLVGSDLSVHKGTQPAPEFLVTARDLSTSTPLPFPKEGVTWLLCSIPSLEMPASQAMIRRCNDIMTQVAPPDQIWVVSMDLPFVLNQFEGKLGDRVWLSSDHREASFGAAYGTLIKELRLLAPALFVVDHQSRLWYAEYLKDLEAEPDYKAVTAALKTMYI